MKRALIIGLVLLASIAIYPVWAQEGQLQTPPAGDTGLQISPAIFESIVNPDAKVTKTIAVTNITTELIPIHVQADSFVPNEQEIDPILRKNFDAASWIKVIEPDFILQPGQRREVTLEINPPANAEPGGHYATIFFQPLVAQINQQGAVAYNLARVGAIAFVVIPGDIKQELKLDNFDVDFWQSRGDIPINFALTNSGNIHELPATTVLVKNLFWQTKAEISIAPRFVLPNTLREFEGAWQQQKWFGIYRLRGLINYGTPTQTIKTDSEWVIILPWGPLKYLIPLLGIGGFLAYRTQNRWRDVWRALTGKI